MGSINQLQTEGPHPVGQQSTCRQRSNAAAMVARQSMSTCLKMVACEVLILHGMHQLLKIKYPIAWHLSSLCRHLLHDIFRREDRFQVEPNSLNLSENWNRTMPPSHCRKSPLRPSLPSSKCPWSPAVASSFYTSPGLIPRASQFQCVPTNKKPLLCLQKPRFQPWERVRFKTRGHHRA